MRLFILAYVFLLTVNSNAAARGDAAALNVTAQASSAEANPAISSARIAYDSFAALFEDKANGLPGDVRVLGVRIRNGALAVNLSDEFLNYGGSENEITYIELFKETARGVPGVTGLTVLINGLLSPLAEGRVVNAVPVQ